MKNKTDDLLTQMKEGAALTKAQRFRLVLTLSIPAILAQIASVVMGYIDAAMVGRLGAEASASISLVSSSTWLFGGAAQWRPGFRLRRLIISERGGCKRHGA